jgi:conjugal transfer mating pair stabilization protein TraG
VAGGGVSLGTYAGIGAVNGETATIAGFMLMSIPFLAAGLARGAMSIAGQATSMLAPAQNAAEAAALEQTTGNYSYGNVSWANATSNMRQSDQWSTAPSYTSGATSVGWRQDNGAVISGFGNGQEVFDTSGAISRLGFTPTMNSGTVAEWRQMASEAHRQAQSFENAAQEILTSTHTDRSAFGTSSERSSGVESGAGSSANTNVEKFDRATASSAEGLEERSSTGQSQRIIEGHDRQAGINDQIAGTLGGVLGGGGNRTAGGGKGRAGGLLPSVSGGLSVTKIGSQNDTLRHGTETAKSTDSSSSSTSGVRDEHSNGTGASTSDGTYERSGVFSRTSSTSSSSQSTEDALAKARSYTEAARKLEELSASLSRDASFAETHGMQLSENMSQDLAQWYRQQQLLHPNLDAPELWATSLTDQQRAVRSQMIQQWSEEKRETLWDEVRGSISEPNLVDVRRTQVGNADDVRTSYHPHGVDQIGSRGPGGDPTAASKIISEGSARLSDERAAAEAARTNRAGATVDLQTEVSRDQNKGFFTDPELRK